MTGTLKDSHIKGWGPICPVWHWFFSQWTHPYIYILWRLGFFFWGGGVIKDESHGPYPIGRQGATHLCGIFRMELASVWHRKMHVPLTLFRLSYVCSDTISEAEVYVSPILLFGSYRAIHVKSNTLKWRFFFCPSLLSSTAQVTPNLCLRCLPLKRCKHQSQSS